jgi:NCS1 family nucleobase:cation symporter-1
VLRRQRLSLPDLFREHGAYTYRGGVNPRAIAALVLSVLPVAPGFVRAATTPGGVVAAPGFLDHLYAYAWFVTFALSFVLYLVLMRGAAAGEGERGVSPDAPRALSS